MIKAFKMMPLFLFLLVASCANSNGNSKPSQQIQPSLIQRDPQGGNPIQSDAETATENNPTIPDDYVTPCKRSGRVIAAIAKTLSQMGAANVSCAQLSRQDIADLKFLDLEGEYDFPIADLRKGDFSGMSGLVDLDLHGNKISTIPDYVFSDLVNLKNLNLNENPITAISSKAFSGLVQLETLSMSGLSSPSLPSNVFAPLYNLKQLDLSRNKLAKIDKQLFQNLSQLVVLELRSNEIDSAPDGVFSNLIKLRKLSLGANHLALSENSFLGLNLTSLKLEDCMMEEIPESVFWNLTNLEILYLQGNRFKILPQNLFKGLTKVKSLALGQNNLERLPPGLLKDLYKLNWFEIMDNPLKRLPISDFDGIQALTHLEIMHGYTTAFEVPASDIQKIKTKYPGIHIRTNSNSDPYYY